MRWKDRVNCGFSICSIEDRRNCQKNLIARDGAHPPIPGDARRSGRIHCVSVTTPQVTRALNYSMNASLRASTVIVIAPGLQAVDPSLLAFRVCEVTEAVTADELATKVEAGLIERCDGCIDVCPVAVGDWVIIRIPKVMASVHPGRGKYQPNSPDQLAQAVLAASSVPHASATCAIGAARSFRTAQ
jgi:hypothetical protein